MSMAVIMASIELYLSDENIVSDQTSAKQTVHKSAELPSLQPFLGATKVI